MSVSLTLATVGLLLANAFFVGAEFAVISARRASIELRAEQGSRAARTVLWAMENVSLMLATAQLGVTVCSVSLGVLAEPALAHALEGPLQSWGLSTSVAHIIAVAIALSIIVWLHVVVGEMVPKNAAVSSPDRAALVFGPPLVAIARVVRPLIGALNWIANLLIQAMGVQPRDEVASAFTADEVHSIVQRSSEEGTIEDSQGLLTGALDFADRCARDVMVPVAEVVAVLSSVTIAECEKTATDTGHSRLLVKDGSELSGYVHFKDVLGVADDERDSPLPAWRVRELPRVRSDDPVEAVLGSMRATRAHVAAVEAQGKVVGAVFLEDILEELVGEVSAQQRP